MEILSLGEKIKKKRKALNMTLKDLAKDRITPGQISLVESGRSNPSMDLLEYLSLNLNTTVEYLIESEDSQAEKISKYYSDLAQSYILNGNYEKAESYIDLAYDYAEKYNLEYRKAKVLFLRGKVNVSKGNLDLAQQFFLSSNIIFIKNNKYEEIVLTFLNLGIITLKLNSYHSACSYLRQAEKVYLDNHIGNEYLIGEIYYFMSKAFFLVEDLERSKEYAYLAKERFNGVYDKETYAKNLLEISERYGENEDISNALKYSSKTLEVYNEIQHLKNVAEIENNLGKLFFKFENFDESFKRYKLAKENISPNDKVKIVETNLNICKNHLKLKNIDKCKRLLEDIYNDITEDNIQGRIDYNLVRYRIYIIREEYKKAEDILVETYGYAKSKEALERAAGLAIMIAKYYTDKKEIETASRYLDEGVQLFRKLKIIEN